MEAAAPMHPIDSTDPIDPTDRIDPIEPIDRIDPTEPIERIDPREPIDQRFRVACSVRPVPMPTIFAHARIIGSNIDTGTLAFVTDPTGAMFSVMARWEQSTSG